MCQIKVVMSAESGGKTLMENVTRLEAGPRGITLHAFFEEPLLVPRASIRDIDFLGGTVTLEQSADMEAAA